MKRSISFSLAIILVLTIITSLVFVGNAAQNAYIKIGDTIYSSPEEIAKVFKYNSDIIKNNTTIEIFGAVEIPFQAESISLDEYGRSETLDRYFWIIGKSNVKIKGMTADATLYHSGEIAGGYWGYQSFIIIFGENTQFEGITFMPPRNTNYASRGYANKTIEVIAKNFTMIDCVLAMNTFGNGTTSGGSLHLNGDKENVIIANNVLERSTIILDSVSSAVDIKISNNTFDGDRGGGYSAIENRTYAYPPVYEMDKIVVESNVFENYSQGSTIINHTMSGEFVLIDNIIDSDGDGEADGEIAEYINIAPVNNIEDKTSVGLVIIQGDEIIELFANEDGSAPIPVQTENGITLDKHTVFMKNSTSHTLIPHKINEKDIRDVIWSSSNADVATVVDGKVTAVNVGTAVITATIAGTNLSASCDVYVGSLTLDKKTYSLNVNMSVSLEATLDIAYDGDLPIVWKSSDTNVALVDQNGAVTAIRQGEAIITATIAGTKISDSCTIYIGQAEKTQSIIDGILEFFRMIFEFLGGLFSGGTK